MKSRMKTLLAVSSVRTPDLVAGATAVRLFDGNIEAIGPAESLRGDGVAEVSFPDGVVFPLLTDAHFHPVGYLQTIDGLSVGGAADVAHLGEMIDLHRQIQPEGPIIGHRLDDSRLATGLPDRQVLDEIEAVRPLVLHRHCGHIAVANTAALQRSGIGYGTQDPHGGSLDRDAGGKPTGVLRESAVAMVTTMLSDDVPGPNPARLIEVLSGLPSIGIGSIHAMVTTGTPMWCGGGNELDQLLAVAADLPITLDVFVITDSVEELGSAAARLSAGPHQLRFAGWKGFADGSLGGHTAAMWSPFSDRASTNGILRLDTTQFRPLIDRALDLGGSIAIHAIGDRANTAVLALYERMIDDGVEAGRLRVEHASVLSNGLIEQMAGLGVVASVQPSFLRSEGEWVPERIGADRSRFTYAFRSMLEAGVTLFGGSDCPVEDPNPWTAIAAATQHSLAASESLELEDAIGLYLREGFGVGDLASFAILDRDPMAVDSASLARTKVLAAWVEGNRIGHRSPTFPS